MKIWIGAIPRIIANCMGVKLDMLGISQFLNVPALQRLNTDEKERVAYFLKSPGKEEFFFFLQVLGKTPAQVRNMMLDEFIRRFELDAHADEIKTALPPKRSWRELDVAIAKFAGSMGAREHLQFWDKMRYVFEAIPQRKDYGDKYSDSHEDRTTRPKRGWNYTLCRFCWRRVAYNPGLHRKTGSLCFKHNLPAKHPLYRKYRRLERHLRNEQHQIAKKLMALVMEYSSEAETQNAINSQLTVTDGCLPRLAKYLDSVGHDGTHESLLWAFHGPASDIKHPLYMEALDEYIQNTLDARDILDPTQPMPIFSIDELSRAEAWLTLLERDGRQK